MDNPYEGIAPGARLAVQRLGHQGERVVIKHNQIPKENANDGLRVCAIDSVFTDPHATFIVFGTPNVSLVMPNDSGDGWDRLAAFMFWRHQTTIAPTKGRVQAGVFCELRGISAKARYELSLAADSLIGTRTPSCAHSTALALYRAGFQATKADLRYIYRPSHLAAVLWGGELTYHGEQVDMRWIITDKSAHDHFKATWWREYRSPYRLVNKLLHKGQHTPTPTFEPTAHSLDMSDEWPRTGVRARISINRPSPLGVNLSFLGLVGQQPEYSIELPRPIDEPLLATPIKPFNRKLSTIDFLKSKVLFSPVTCWAMGKILEKDIGTTDFLPVEVIAKMLTPAPMDQRANPDPVYKYNFVLTRTTLKVKRLLNNDGTENKFLAWMLAKHVLLSRWAKNILAAGELWVCNDHGELYIYINGESGSYQPTHAQITALAQVLSEMFGLPVFAGERIIR